ncbi:sugar transferase [Oscillochloris sp. ZM17-4]|uniref:sugar transferase n=1 Tax=Oscillochloris sp. ZM17-4 TaxID=2866714 RepID=UPI001C73102E|nr:sugar transferase [Oscillochloris sp. ZM17-4]MBX0331335.1 sugar transferase [Oscillochloris sp. ZM17-4]
MYRRIGKRALDLVLGVLALVVLSPVMLVTALLIRTKLGAPIFFRQERAGLRGRPFMLFKFRTMTDACDAHGNLLPDPERMTPLGHFLRSTSLDELPGLLNVLMGDMSLIGPRPLLVTYLGRYTSFQNRRHEVKPGVAGYAALFGGDSHDWDAIFRHDVWYVDNYSFWKDIEIMARILLAVIRRDSRPNSYRGDQSSVPEFKRSALSLQVSQYETYHYEAQQPVPLMEREIVNQQ